MTDVLKQQISDIHKNVDYIVGQVQQAQFQNRLYIVISTSIILLSSLVSMMIILDKNKSTALMLEQISSLQLQLSEQQQNMNQITNSILANQLSDLEKQNQQNTCPEQQCEKCEEDTQYRNKQKRTLDHYITLSYHKARDEQFVFTNRCGEVKIIDFNKVQVNLFGFNSILLTSNNQVNYASLSNDCAYYLKTIDSDLDIYQFKEKKAVLLKTIIYGDKMTAKAFRLSTNGRFLFSSGSDFLIRVWNFHTFKEVTDLRGHSGVVTDLIDIPRYNLLISASEDTEINLWNITNWKLITSLQGHKNKVRQLVYSLTHNSLISSSDDKTLRFWSLPQGTFIRKLTLDMIPIHMRLEHDYLELFNSTLTMRLNIDQILQEPKQHL